MLMQEQDSALFNQNVEFETLTFVSDIYNTPPLISFISIKESKT